MPDLSKLSDSDLDALEAGDLTRVSDSGLDILEDQYGGARSTQPETGFGSRMRSSVGAAVRGSVRGGLQPIYGAVEQARAGIEAGSGEAGPAAAGAIAGSLLASRLGVPGVGGALVSSLAAGGGGVGGEALSELVREGELVGGKVIRRGVEAALTDLGGSAAAGTLRAVFPIAAQLFLKFPSESIKRAMGKPQLIKLGPRAKAQAQEIGIAAVDDIQKAIETARKRAGMRVDAALSLLEKRTGGKPVIKADDVMSAGMDVLTKAGAFDPLAGSQLKGEVKFLEELFDKMPSGGRISAREAVNLRRRLDDMISYRPGGVQKVTSDVQENMVREMASALRAQIDLASEVFNFKALRRANANFHDVSTAYNEMGEIFKTPSDSKLRRLERFNKATKMFYEGGIPQDILRDVGKSFPKALSAVENLLDASAGMSFTELPSTAPSNMLFNAFRMLSAPPVVGAGIRVGAGVPEMAGQFAKPASQVATSALDHLIFERRKK